MKISKVLFTFVLMLSIKNTFSEGRILKNELPKDEREFFENNLKKGGEEET